MKKIVLLLFSLLIISGCGKSVDPFATPTAEAFYEPNKETASTLPGDVVEGIVVNSHNEPIANAVVRLQATSNSTISDSNGFFRLSGIDLGEPKSITAWFEGFYINNTIASDDKQNITIVLEEIPNSDNKHYSWLSSGNTDGEGEDHGCAECHAGLESKQSIMLPVEEWLQDAHSQSAVNSRFLTVYNGTDTQGNKSPETVFIPAQPYTRNSSGYNYIALSPDPNKPYYGPGYKLDFPNSAGNCGTCHVPGEAAKPGQSFGTDPNKVHGVIQEGIFCDFCHKVWDVVLDPDSDLPFSDSPGVLSFEFRRPEEGHQFFAGPFDDVAPGEDTYTPIQKESAFCAPCHFGIFWDNPIYNSYGEWLDSSYSDPHTGQTCQDCHMPRRGATLFALPSAGANQRDPDTIFSHLMPGATDSEFLQNAVTLNASANNIDQKINVHVEILNDNIGHNIPTDYPGRQLILLVQAYDSNDQLLELLEGPTLPEWTGVGDREFRYFSGLPGTAYAIILEEVWTGISPTIAYWNPYIILSDNRIQPFETAVSDYIFEPPHTDTFRIDIQLIFRRNFIDVMDWKQWDAPDFFDSRKDNIFRK